MSLMENSTQELLSSGAWSVDTAHSTIEFRVKHMMIQTVKGRFRDFFGAIVAGDNPSVTGTINVESLETLHADRDAHLRSPDFFDIERYPQITFQAAEIEFNGDGRHFTLPGELTIKGITRPITLDGEVRGSVVDGESRWVALALSGQIERSDYGLVWNRVLEGGGVLVADTVELVLDVAALRVD